jgi:glycosyltransferase involved in cell wall biosynthesis
MRIAFLHTHVIEDLSRFGISRESYTSHFGYEHRYVRLFNNGPYRASLVTFSRSVNEVLVSRHVWGHEIRLIPLRGFKGVRYLRGAGALVKTLKEFDLVHCFSYYSNIYDFVAPICGLLGIPIVAQAQGIYPNLGKSMCLRKFFTLRLAEKLLPLNSSEAEFLKKRFKIGLSKIEVIPNFVDPADHVALPKDVARRSIGIGDEEFVVLTVCRLVPQKGVQTLLKAASRLRDISGLRVLVVGDGPYRKDLEKLTQTLVLEDVVRFEGWVHGGRVGLYYSAADCFVLASSEEGLPFVLLEAAMYGLPLIVSDNWGTRDVLSSGVPGFLVPVGDDESLAENIRRVYADPLLRERFRRVVRDEVLKRYSPENVYRRLSVVYQASVAKQSS